MEKSTAKFQIDTLDKQILSILKENARVPFLEVARDCHISGAAVHQRVQRLIRLGLISKSQFVLNPKRLGYETCAFMGIFLERASMFKDVVEEIGKIPEVTECHYIMGNYSIFIKVYARNNEHLKSILLEKLQVIKGITRTETLISLEQTIDRQIPVE
ncbi:MAG: Lrp/AsnC ligand binding domain-containing protein [Bacteroidales bacterium]|nr:Lrp/AsnC ligand binding domain-containing protein [Bacteroidales bacterium]MCR5714061.1 Lrp/AsnC ligand binding domain-containing protein [Bacteroidales bacterium]